MKYLTYDEVMARSEFKKGDLVCFQEKKYVDSEAIIYKDMIGIITDLKFDIKTHPEPILYVVVFPKFNFTGELQKHQLSKPRKEK